MPLTPGLVIGGPNFLQVAGSGTPADCTSSFSLAPGATCNLSISFEPQSVGNLTAAATFTDNALNNIPSASQSIGLQGIGQATQTGLGQMIAFTQAAPASASYYSVFTVAAQSTSGLTVALSVDAASTGVCSVGTPSVASGVTSATVAMLSATGVCTIDANQAGNGNYDAAAQQQTSATATAIIGTSLTVTNTNDSGSGSLRDAMANAASGDTINFSLAYPATITLASTLTINTNLTISGPGASNLAISGNNAVQVFYIYGSTVNISGVTIENGNASSSEGGGLENGGTLTLTNSTVSGNSATYDGGGIYNYGTLILTNSTVSGNSATYDAGGIYNQQGTLTLNNSTVSGNSTYWDVGGIYNQGTLTLTNSTVSGNSTTYDAGGIFNWGTLTLSNSTVSGNSASWAGGIYNYGTLTAKNSIVANNSGGDCYLQAAIASQGHNLSDDASCAFAGTGDMNSTAAGLDPGGLKANGGPTQTIALLATSPAVDAIPLSPVNYCTDTNGNPVTSDQRGVTRPQGPACDIGAYELNQTQAGQTSQTITFTQPAPASAGYNSTFPVAAQATSGLTVTLSVDSSSTSVCSLGTPSLAGGVTNATVTMLSGTGTCTIFAIQPGNASYSAALQQTSATAQAIGQTITFTQAAPATASYYSAFTVAAQSTSGLTVTLSVDSSSIGVCSLGTPSVAGGVTSAEVTMQSAAGVCTIDANQSGNGNYTAAAQQQTSATATTATTGGTFTVTNTNDSGFGSLRDAMANAASGDTINFSLAYPATITLASTLTINTNLTISGPGASNLAISGNNAVQVFYIYGSTVNISGVTIENGNASSSEGGGLENGGTLTLTNSTVSGNSATYDGGGIYNYGTLILTNSTVSGNSATYDAGGIYNQQGTLTLNNSTVSGNSTYWDVGGIYNQGTLTLTNSTVSGNSTTYDAGGIFNWGTLTLSNSTVSGNSASWAGGIYNYGTLTAKNSIVANNSGGDCYLQAAIASQGHNLSDDASCAFAGTGDMNSTAAGLDPGGLKANGGPTQTIALLATSPAVDAIPLSPVNYCTDTNGNPVTSDQRGVTRPQGPACDIGAYELNQTQAGQTSQTITFTQPAPASAGYNSTFPVAAQATSGLTVTLSVDSSSTSVCSLGTPSLAGGVTNATVTMLSGTGTCTIFAIQPGNASYSAALQQTSATAQAIGQTITFTQAAPATASYYSAFTVAAQSTSGLTVTLSVDSSSIGVCSLGTPSVAGGVTSAEVTMQSAAGVCTIDANQSGNGNYTAAAQQQTSATATTATTGGTFTVTNTNDSGFGSLRDAMANAASGDTINFSLAYPATITLASTLTMNTSLTISGPGASNLAISGYNAVQVFSIGGGITVNISGLTIENGNSGSSFGGGFENGGTLTLTNSTVSGNSASYVGGIYNTGTLTLSNSTVSGNSASYDVGGIYNAGTLTLSNSTVSGNSTSFAGGIYNYGTLTLSNSTVSSNSASGAAGGIYNYGTLTLGNSTVSGNSATYDGGGIYNQGTLTAKNSIVANNSGGDCYLQAAITSQGHNLSDDASCAFAGTGDMNSTAAGLDPGGLKANGGPTQTIALLATSPAVDAIPLSPINYCTDTNGNPVTSDQRGVTRPQGPVCDIGAFEMQIGIYAPVNSSALTGTSATFQWYDFPGATAYRLDVGKEQGGNEYYQSGSLPTSTSSETVNSLPTDGSTVWVRWYYMLSGTWQHTDYSYTASGGRVAITSPAPSSTLGGSSVTFNWTAGAGASAYWLVVGSTAGGDDYYSSGNLGNVRTATANGLPTNGSTVYVTLYSLIGGAWVPNAYTYTAFNGAVGGVVTTPTSGSTLSGSSVTFNWTTGAGASAYWLVVGSTAGGTNYYSSELSGLTATVNGLPTNGSTLYVTLYSLIGGAWVPNAYTYTAVSAAAGGIITTPTPGSTLSGSSVTFGWTAGAGASAYWLVVGSTAGGDDYYSSGNLGNVRTATVNGLPMNGSTVYVTLYSLIGGAWVPNAYTYTAFNGAVGGVVTTPTSGSTLSGSSVTFNWTTGTGVSAYWLVVGSTSGGDDYYSSGNLGLARNTTVSSLPANGSAVYVTLYSDVGGQWLGTSSTYVSGP